MRQPWRQISLAKGAQRFIFRYCRGEEGSVLDAFRALANNPASGFDWFDAAVLSFKLAKRLERRVQFAKSA